MFLLFSALLLNAFDCLPEVSLRFCCPTLKQSCASGGSGPAGKYTCLDTNVEVGEPREELLWEEGVGLGCLKEGLSREWEFLNQSLKITGGFKASWPGYSYASNRSQGVMR